MRAIVKAAAAAAMMSCAPAGAEVYLGGGVLSSSYEYSDVSSGTGSKLFLGYHIDGFPMLFEAARLDLGKPQVNNFSQGGISLRDATLGWTGNNYSVGYFGSQPQIKLGWWGKVGFYDGTSKLQGTVTGSSGSRPFNISENSSGLSWGLGVQYMFTPYFGALLDLEALNNLKDVPTTDSKSTVTTFSAGIVIAFPPFREVPAPAPRHHEARRRPRPPMLEPLPQAAPVPPPATAAAAPAESAPATAAPSPAPAPSAPVTFAPGTQAHLKAGAILRSRAAAEGEPVAGVDASTSLTLKVVLKKDTGAWWYVSAPTGSGWVLDTDLEALP